MKIKGIFVVLSSLSTAKFVSSFGKNLYEFVGICGLVQNFQSQTILVRSKNCVIYRKIEVHIISFINHCIYRVNINVN